MSSQEQQESRLVVLLGWVWACCKTGSLDGREVEEDQNVSGDRFVRGSTGEARRAASTSDIERAGGVCAPSRKWRVGLEVERRAG